MGATASTPGGGVAPKVLRGHTADLRCCAWSAVTPAFPAGLVATGEENRTCVLWDPVSGTPVRKLAHGGAVYGVAFSRDGLLLLTCRRVRPSSALAYVPGLSPLRPPCVRPPLPPPLHSP